MILWTKKDGKAIHVICAFFKVVAFLLLTSGAQSQTHDTMKGDNRALRQELLDMAAADQAVRRVLNEKGFDKIDSLDVMRIQKVDSANRERLMQIIAQYGWPKKETVGQKGVEAAFIIVQHADLDPKFQREMLPFILQSYKDGVLSGEDVALLIDRILTNEGKPQRYGTQVEIIDGDVVVKPIENPEKVDELRAEMGMPPLERYIRELKKFYGLGDKRH